MKLGIILPLELRDVVALRDFVQAIEELGYDYISFGDHVLGVNPAQEDRLGPYTNDTMWHEPMVTIGYVAGMTKRIGLGTGVVILPQRQAVLVAKQAAQADFLSGGRFQLGIGVGWNPTEYQALGIDFHTRGKRMDEQIDVMRQLWCNDIVTFHGQWHTIEDAGLNPLPVQRPIPILMGGWSDPTISRLVRCGDGWLLYTDLETEGKPAIEKMHRKCEETGRNPEEIEIRSYIIMNSCDVLAGERQQPGAEVLRSPEDWAKDARAWKAAGARHLDCWTTWGGLDKVDQHVTLARRFKEVVDAI